MRKMTRTRSASGGRGEVETRKPAGAARLPDLEWGFNDEHWKKKRACMDRAKGFRPALDCGRCCLFRVGSRRRNIARA